MQWSAKNVVRSKTRRTLSEVTQRKYKLCSVKQMELCKCGQGAREILRRNITRSCGKMLHIFPSTHNLRKWEGPCLLRTCVAGSPA